MSRFESNYRVFEFLFFFARHKIISIFIAIFVFGAIYKYNRAIFYTGGYEITYKYEYIENSAIDRDCGNGIHLNVANTGTKLYPHLEINLDEIPYDWTEAICIKNKKIPVGESYDKETEEKIIVKEKRFDGTVIFHIYDMAPGWDILIYVCEPKIEFEERDWSNSFVELKGRGSIINESPTKVLIVNKINKYTSYISMILNKTFNFLFKW